MNDEICIARQMKVEDLSSDRFCSEMVCGEHICNDSCTITEAKTEADRKEILSLVRKSIFHGKSSKMS